MKTILKSTRTLFLLMTLIVMAEGKEIPFVLDDRDRIFRNA